VNEAITDLSLWGLFVSAFVSSTLLPGGSEVLLAYLHSQQVQPWWLLWLVATAGNSLGGLTSWGLGWWLARRFPLKKLEDKKQQRALNHVQRWGSPALLMSWLPIIGDPLCLVAGWLRMNFWLCCLFIVLGKGVRYLLVLAVI
jgi:membrane protein YqaA with SNARE-associated domain